MKRIKIFYKGKSLNLDLKEMKGFKKGIGLMFCRREKAKALLFEFKRPVKIAIHSWFVFFPFVGIWLDERNKIISIKKVSGFRNNVSPKQKFSKLIEIPINKNYLEIVKFLVGY